MYVVYRYHWDIPVWHQIGAEPVKLSWLPYNDHLFLPKTDEPIVLNADSYAIARMNYNEAGWRRILHQLTKNHTIYSSRTKYRIISDVFAMADINEIDYDLAFDFAQYMVIEDDSLPWNAFITELEKHTTNFKNTQNARVADVSS